MRYRLGVDVGGTFTDILLIDEALSVGDASFKQKSGARIDE